MWLEDEKEQAVGKAPGKNIPGRWKHICKDPEVKAIVGSLWNRRMPSVAGENERKVPDGDQRGGQGLDHAHARSQAAGRMSDFFSLIICLLTKKYMFTEI